jgi:hypothetical protein
VRSIQRGLRLSLAAGMCAVLVPWLVPSANAATPTISASPGGAEPGHSVTISGVAPGCLAQPFQFVQDYTDFKGNRVQAPGRGGIAGLNGAFSFSATVPSQASRSDILRPFSAWQYDTVVVTFPGCHGGTVIGVNVKVLPFNREALIWLSQSAPRSGSKLHVTVTHCLGGVLPQFTQLVDRTGEYFHIQGSVTNGTFRGTANLAHGFYGDSAPGPAAHPSPRGVKDSVVAVACTQSEGPRWVAQRDVLWHSNLVVDVHIRKRA